MSLQLEQAKAILGQKNGNPDRALKLLHGVLKKEGESELCYRYMGLGFLKKREYKTALAMFNTAMEMGGGNEQIYQSVSQCYLAYNQFKKAEEYAKKAIIANETVSGWMHLGEIYRKAGKLNKALVCYQKANGLDPANWEVAYRSALIYSDQGFHEKALGLLDIVLRLEAGDRRAMLKKGEILEKLGRLEEAETVYRSLIDRDRSDVQARIRKTELHRKRGDFESLQSSYKALLDEYKNRSDLHTNYALSKAEVGEFSTAEMHYRQALEINPADRTSLSNYLMMLHYNPERSAQEIFREHRLWDQYYAPSRRPERPLPLDRSAERPLRIGLISGGFWRHPVGWMITGGLEKLSGESFEIYCYSTNHKVDSIAKRLYRTSDSWKIVTGLSDKRVAEMIREDEIDILVELSGHSAHNRLNVVAMEPAPISVKWVGGLFNTSGLESMDFLISDRVETPEGVDEMYTEKLVRMSDDYICFTPPDYAPDTGPLPFDEEGAVTFGCFNTAMKVNGQILEVWAEIMNRVPDSRLLLKNRQYETDVLKERIAETMESAGIDRSRLIFEGASPHRELLETYNRVDVALDPWPYSGGLTTCEALWMGVPVVTFPGATFAGRHSATHLTHAGFGEWVTGSFDEYIEVATGLVTDPERLREIRRGLRERVANSPLTDSNRFARNLERAFREMWRQRVEAWEKQLPEGEWASAIDLGDHGSFPQDNQQIKRVNAIDRHPETRKKESVANSMIADQEPVLATGREIRNHAGSEPTRVLHLCFNHIYTECIADLVDYANRNSGQEHWALVEGSQAIPKFDAHLDNHCRARYFDRSRHYGELVQLCKSGEVDIIFFHGLFFSWQKELIREVSDKTHVAWKLWGGDLYGPLKQGKPIHDVMNHVDSVHARVQGDFEIIEQTYGPKRFCKFGYTFPGLYGDLSHLEQIEKEDPPLIIVGNSGDPGNDHTAILTSLFGKEDIGDYRILLPVAYNFSSGYRQTLVRHIRRLGLSGITRLQDRFLSPDQFARVMGRASMLVTAHHRQQAIGSILTSIYCGNRTFLRKQIRLSEDVQRNPAWGYLEDHGLCADSFEELADAKRISEFESPDKSQVQHHRRLIHRQIGLEARGSELLNVCDEISAEDGI